jgi:NAD(P)-dependent dehydrogenase (short-subunit alcohol dehydrogenase family)
MNKLKNKIIVVTGGSGLLGKAILKYLAAEGAIAINADINVSDDLANHTLCFDITVDRSVKKAVDLLIAFHGYIDGWVNCAYPRTADWGEKFETIDPASWRKNVDTQLNSLFVCCQSVLSRMTAERGGSIVNIASVYGIVGPDFGVYEGTQMTMPAAYSAIKGAVVNFTRYLASYYGPTGIRINCVSPGGIFDNQNERFVTQYKSRVPLRRMGLPADIAPSVGFLLSDEASYITGHNLVVDGGWTII